MQGSYPSSWASLSHPWVRAELLLTLEELSATDPREQWIAERQKKMVSGVNQIIHFLFDDNDFGEADVGATLLDRHELALIEALKGELDSIIDERPQGNNDDYVAHPLWPKVTAAAVAARDAVKRA